jgi:hypothetical protein
MGVPVGKLKVILSLITGDSDYQVEQAKAAEAVAREQNAGLEVIYAGSDSVTQSTQLVELIHKFKSETECDDRGARRGTEFPRVKPTA